MQVYVTVQETISSDPIDEVNITYFNIDEESTGNTTGSGVTNEEGHFTLGSFPRHTGIW